MTASVEGMLPTIRSRCQSVRFNILSNQETASVLRQTGIADSDEVSANLAELVGGSVADAELLSDQNWVALKQEIEQRLANLDRPRRFCKVDQQVLRRRNERSR